MRQHLGLLTDGVTGSDALEAAEDAISDSDRHGAAADEAKTCKYARTALENPTSSASDATLFRLTLRRVTEIWPAV